MKNYTFLLFTLFTISIQAVELSPCPDKPNCVSSIATDKDHNVEPLLFTGTSDQFEEKVKAVVLKFPRTEIIKSEKNYVHATFKTKIMGFTDDVEFLFQPEKGQIQIRSASRTGYSDMGVNRKRAEDIKKLF